MKKISRASRSRKITYMLLALAVILLFGSAVGSTRAALTYYSENYTAQIRVGQIGVSLLENGNTVTRRDYDGDRWVETSGALLENMLRNKDGKEDKLILNKTYPEKLTVKNSGDIEEYVRVRIYRYWIKNGKKETKVSPGVNKLPPSLIRLPLANTDMWLNPDKGTLSDEEILNKECIELYYKNPLEIGEETLPFAETIAIDGQIANDVTITTDGNIITTTYKYDGAEFRLEVEVDAVQTHNAQDAIKSAWGINAKALGIQIEAQ